MNTILAWAFIFAVQLFAFVYAWFFMAENYFADRVVTRAICTSVLVIELIVFFAWLLNLPA